MFLKQLRIWNFRKYGTGKTTGEPGLMVQFNKGLNLIVGENDSGKSAVIDAIKQVLCTQSFEYIRIEESDFYKSKNGTRADNLKIECLFAGFKDEEAANFLEWATFDDKKEFELRVVLTSAKNTRIMSDIKAGPEGAETLLDSNARDLLRTTYLKPLRDAESELVGGKRSRFSQILRNIDVLKHEKDTNGNKKKHTLEKYIETANRNIEGYFQKDTLEVDENNDIPEGTRGAKIVTDELNTFLKDFFSDSSEPFAKVNISGNELIDILNRLSVSIDENKSGLGSLNLLFIATELLLLQKEHQNGLKLILIEEIEAHLHPQAQLRLLDFLKKKSCGGQYILTTHSTSLASAVNVENILLFKGDKVFNLSPNYTKLDNGDYAFLERFLDATKSNLFFARGVILVEGDAENILLPTIANIIERPLHKFGVSIVNVGSTAHLRYANIFLRNAEPYINIPVSLVRDIDVRPIEYYDDEKNEKTIYKITDANIGDLKTVTEIVNFDAIRVSDEIFTSKSAFDKAIDSNKNGRLSKFLREEIHSKSTFVLDEKGIEQLKGIRKTKLCSKDEQNVKTFVTDNWTLEYDIAFSSLKEYLQKAISISELIEDNNNLTPSKDQMNEIDADIIETNAKFERERLSAARIAYNIYLPLLKCNISKSIVAQQLAKLLYENATSVKTILETDPNLKYIRDAIYHVTKPQTNQPAISVAENANN